MEDRLEFLEERIWNRKKYYVLFFLFTSFIFIAEKKFAAIPLKSILLVTLLLFFVLFCWSKKIEKNVLLIIVVFGGLFSLLSPIYDVWDEPAHFARTQYISEGNLFLSNDKNSHVTSEDLSTLDDLTKLDKFLEKSEERLPNTLESVLWHEKLPNTFETALWHEKHSREKEYNKLIPVTNAYGTVAYFPSVLGYNIGKTVSGGNLGVMFYLGRLFNVLFYAICTFIAVKLSRQWQHVLAFFALQPMLIYSSSSFNQDAFSYGLLLIIASLFFRMIQNEDEKIDCIQLTIYFLLCAILAYTKLPYVALGGLPFFIPFKKYKNKNTYFFMYVGIVFVIVISALWFVYYSGIEGLPPKAENVNPVEQVKYIWDNPKDFVGILLNSLYTTINKYWQLATFSWDKEGSGILTLINLISLGVVFTFPMKGIEKVSLWTKTGVVVITLLISTLIYLSMYLTWNDVGHYKISGVQGRYFVGIVLLLPIVFNISKYIGSVEENNYTKIMAQIIPLTLIIWTLGTRIAVYY